MNEWYEKPYKGGPMAVPAKYFPRPLYPPDANNKIPSENGPDVIAYKRTISRLGRWNPWDPKAWDGAYNNSFSHGRGTGNVGDSGVAGFQRQMNIDDTGYMGKATFNTLASCRVPEGREHEGEMAMDPNAVNLIMEAYAIYGGEEHNPDYGLTTRERALKGAQGDVGYVETGNNDTFYGQWYGMNYQPYCAMAVTYWYEIDGGGSNSFSRGAAYSYCPYLLADARAHRGGLSVVDTPIPGDIVLFDFHWDGIADHVGLFESGNHGAFTTIEANTSPEGSGGSQSNGGGVWRRNRSQADAQIWFVRADEP